MADKQVEHAERWAESEAAFCDKMVSDYQRMAQEWWDKGLNSYSALAAQNAYECALRATVWKQMADHLRQPRRCRLEREHYEALHKDTGQQ